MTPELTPQSNNFCKNQRKLVDCCSKVRLQVTGHTYSWNQMQQKMSIL